MLGNHTIKTSSLTQRVVGLSSGETEYYALTTGALGELESWAC